MRAGAAERDAARASRASENDTQEWAQATLDAGQVVHIQGIPFELVEPVSARSHPNNFALAGFVTEKDS